MNSKWKRAYAQISETAMRLMYYGTKAALGVLLIGIFVYKYNEWIFNGGYNTEIFCIKIIQAAVSMFIQFIIGGLIYDCVIKKRR